MPRGIPNSRFQDAEVSQTSHIDMPTTGEIESLLKPEEVQVVSAAGLDDYAAELAFMEEKIDVIVHESTDKNAEQVVDVYCNGTPQRFIRGQVQSVKRKYVQILADARQTSLQTRTVTQGEDVYNRIDRHTALRYPFSVANDPNPKGAQWLKRALQAA